MGRLGEGDVTGSRFGQGSPDRLLYGRPAAALRARAAAKARNSSKSFIFGSFSAPFALTLGPQRL